MAKKRSRSNTARRRDTSAIATDLSVLLSPISPPSGRTLQDVEDGRLHRPPSVTPTPRTVRRVARIGVPATPRPVRASRPLRQPLRGLSFAAPDQVLVCVRRKRRKAVLHAKGVAGRRGLRKPRRNFWSSISCKR